MLRYTAFLRPVAALAVLLPLASWLACSSSEDDVGAGANATGNAGAGGGGAAQVGGGMGGQQSAGGGASGSGVAGAGASSGAAGAAVMPGEPQGSGGSASARVGPEPVNLRSAAQYAILAQSAISNVPTSSITGDLGLSPAAASYITGFPLTRAGMMWTTPEVVGGVFAADSDPTTPVDLTTAVGDMQTAYEDAAGRLTPEFLNLGDGAIGGRTLLPGLYKWTSTVTIPADVTLAGAARDVWIFQITGDFTLSADKKMILSGGAQPKNIVWQVAGSVDLGTTSHAEGIILSKTTIAMGDSASINGRLLAQTAVSIAHTTVTAPAP